MAEYKVVVSWELLGDDVRQCQFGLTGDPGLPEGDWEASFDFLWEQLRGFYKPGTVLSEFTWYEGRSGTPPNISWGTPFRVIPRNAPGLASGINHFQLPPQCSVVVTFNPRDATLKRHRGRIFLPAPSTFATVESNGRLASPGAWVDPMAQFLDAVRGGGWQPSIISIVGGLPVMADIGSIKVDDVIDTQRRRAYTSSTNTQTRTLATGP